MRRPSRLSGGAVARFDLLRYGLAALVFVGVKMVWLDDWFEGTSPIGASLAVIGSVLALSWSCHCLCSVRRAHRERGIARIEEKPWSAVTA